QSGIQTWCEAHRDELTGNGKVKFANLTTGEVQWRNRPPSVSIRGADNVIELLRRLGLERFIRVKEEINKDAILNEKEAVKNIPGITIKSDIEDFSIIPFEQDVQ
ncbi:host-nuclease inhibitor Gam family protein, partial [Escherichia coli]|nr:host-nuclease inhibitor Gam family protein [Escherichia coli]